MRALLVALMFALFALPAAAAGPDFCKDGQLVTLRISKIKPGGSVEGVIAASKEHEAWYRAHGFNGNKQVVARVVALTPDKMPELAKDEIATLHINPPDPKTVTKDAAWDAYVAKYKANSEIVTEKFLCVPKGTFAN